MVPPAGIPREVVRAAPAGRGASAGRRGPWCSAVGLLPPSGLPTDRVAYVALLGPNECFDARSQVVASVRGRSVIFYS
jgi:hypothetical protein